MFNNIIKNIDNLLVVFLYMKSLNLSCMSKLHNNTY
jgi:hypothetical protein